MSERVDEIRCGYHGGTAARLARENAGLRRELDLLSRRHTAVLDERDALAEDAGHLREKLDRIAAEVHG